MRKVLAIIPLLAVAACDGPTTPKPGEGAAGLVAEPNAGGAVNPVTPALSGGPAGQTPAWGQPGGAPAISRSQGDGAPPSVGGDGPAT